MIVLTTSQGKLTFDGQQWTAPDPELTERLNALNLQPLMRNDYYPDLAYAQAQLVADLLKGEIVQADEPDFDPDRIY